MSLFTVKQGIIHVQSINIVDSSDKFVYFEINCKQKYPKVLMISGGGLHLGADSKTLKVDKLDASPTEIIVKLNDGLWNIIAEAGRYSVSVAALKMPGYTGEDNPLDWYAERSSTEG